MVVLVHMAKYQCPTNATYSTPSSLPVIHTSHSPLPPVAAMTSYQCQSQQFDDGCAR